MLKIPAIYMRKIVNAIFWQATICYVALRKAIYRPKENS